MHTMVSAKGGYADLHVHTWFSDSTMSPSEVVAEAVRRNVTLLAVADHEGFQGSEEAEKAAKSAGIDFIPAAELECAKDGVMYHILCYGADRENQELRQLAKRNRYLLDKMSEDLIERMSRDYPVLSPEEFAHYTYDRSRGGWKGLYYLMDMGVTKAPMDAMPFYDAYGVTYQNAGFPQYEDLAAVIHAAGGKAVAAHPGHTLRTLSLQDLQKRMLELIRLGLDGIECYYPRHGTETVRMLVALCRQNHLLITAGSDCHGAFGKTCVGEMSIPRDALCLDGLMR